MMRIKKNNYAIIHKGIRFSIKATTALEAIEKLASREIYGAKLFTNLELEAVDTDTQGERWMMFLADGKDTLAIEKK